MRKHRPRRRLRDLFRGRPRKLVVVVETNEVPWTVQDANWLCGVMDCDQWGRLQRWLDMELCSDIANERKTAEFIDGFIAFRQALSRFKGVPQEPEAEEDEDKAKLPEDFLPTEERPQRDPVSPIQWQE